MGNAFGETANGVEWVKNTSKVTDKTSGSGASALAENKTGC